MLSTARHSSGVRSSGYDVILLADEAEDPNKALRKGIEGMDNLAAAGTRGGAR